jgi:GTP-binding protein
MPLVVLVGRVNVGKSTIFNRLSKKVRSLALDYEGVTRDYLKDVIVWHGARFALADTGGFDLQKTNDPIIQQVQERVKRLLDAASIIVLVMDASVGVTAYEFELAKILRAYKKPVLIAANKIDIKSAHEHLDELKKLGFTAIFPITAVHNRGLDTLLDAIAHDLPKQDDKLQKGEQACRVALLGRPNVGKSSLMNAVLKQERSIVTNIPGTTREAITEPLRFYAQTIELTDTAGVRKKKAVDEPIEELMVKSSLSAVRTADIVVLVVEAQEGRLTDQELKLAFYAFEQGKALIVAINKSDLLDAALKDAWRYHMAEYDFFYKKITFLQLSCKTGDRVGKLMPLIDTVWQRYQLRFNDHEITLLLKNALLHSPLYRKEQRVQLMRIQQVKSAPPTLALTVNIPKLVGERELAFFEGVLRKNYNLVSIPLVFTVGEKTTKTT